MSNFKYRNAITKLRTSSHDLQVEKGSHGDYIVPLELRLCQYCNTVEDEMHFLVSCKLFNKERSDLYARLDIQNLFNMSAHIDIFRYLMCSHDQRHLELMGEFIYKCFKKRKSFLDGL